MSKLNNMWQKIWGKQMNQIVEKVEHITANGKYADQGSIKRDESSWSSYGALTKLASF